MNNNFGVVECFLGIVGLAELGSTKTDVVYVECMYVTFRQDP
jgi:hypothetical protein